MEACGLCLAIGAILKNEGPYILEWVAYHRVLGVDRFFLADNGEGEDRDDGSAALLAALDRAGIVDRMPFPGEPGRPPQLPAYAEILRRHGAEADWIAFIDADEFLLPAPPRRSLRPVLAAFESRPGAGAVTVNWAVYGSSGETAARPGLVVERFIARDGDRFTAASPLQDHPAAAGLRWPPRDPAPLPPASGTYAVHADGRPVRTVPGEPPGVSEAAVWTPLRLNHYVVKSREEFLRREQPRGRASRPPRSAIPGSSTPTTATSSSTRRRAGWSRPPGPRSGGSSSACGSEAGSAASPPWQGRPRSGPSARSRV